MRLGYRVVYRLLVAWSFLRRPRVRGVMCLLVDGRDRVLLVRHTYGDRSAWELPGGWVGRDENHLEAARREAFEEVGVDIAEWRSVGALDGIWHFRREHLELCAAGWPGGHATLDPVEIAEARWFAPDALPDRLGEGARAALGAVYPAPSCPSFPRSRAPAR